MSSSSETVDEQVLRLRQRGQAYARISRELGLDRATDAQQAFRRALRRLPEAEATPIRNDELARLDRLTDRVHGDTTRDEADRARQLKTIDTMRRQLQDDRG